MTHTIIIGGSKGTGRAVAKLFTEEDHKVSIISRSKPQGENRIPGADYFSADISQPSMVELSLSDALAQNGPANYVVFCQRYRGEEASAWEGEFKVSVDATKRTIDYLTAKEDRLAQGDKSFVVVSSVASDFVLYQQPLSYHVGKAALDHMVDYYAVNLGPKGVRVNAVLPGTILKDENTEFYRSQPDLMRLYSEASPSGRMITAEEIANVVDFLCSPKSSAVTGQKIKVDGGLSLVGQESLLLKRQQK